MKLEPKARIFMPRQARHAIDEASSFKSLSYRFFITTYSGGDSPYLGWIYNAVVESRSEAKWDPLRK